jgi:hypothetical protein
MMPLSAEKYRFDVLHRFLPFFTQNVSVDFQG